MSEQRIISLEVPSDLSDWTAEQGRKSGGNRSTFIRGLILQAKRAADAVVMDDVDAARAQQGRGGIVSMRQLRAARRKGGAR